MLEVRIEDCLTICSERLLDCVSMPRYQIDTKFLCVDNNVTAGVAIPFGVLRHQLLDPSLRHCEGVLSVPLLDCYLLAEGLLK